MGHRRACAIVGSEGNYRQEDGKLDSVRLRVYYIGKTQDVAALVGVVSRGAAGASINTANEVG